MKKLQRLILLILVVGIVASLIAQNWEFAKNLIVAMVGFGAIVFVHELGHFIVARCCDIKCESFAIGFGPFLLGIKREVNSLRIRVLPKTSGVRTDPESDCMLMLNVPFFKCKEGETEYCIGLTPLGGFVKMLGQDDTGVAAATDDPRSFANKTVGAKMAVVCAGVVFNIIGAFVIFLCLARFGFDKIPAVVGGIIPHSPAAVAGLEYGDEIVSINGKSLSVQGKPNIDFSHIKMAAIFSNGDPVDMKVKTPDGQLKDVAISADSAPGDDFPKFGIIPLQSLEVDAFQGDLGIDIEPGDVVTAVDGDRVENSDQFMKLIYNKQKQSASGYMLELERTDPSDGQTRLLELWLDAYTGPLSSKMDSEKDLDSIFTLVPRLKVAQVNEKKENVFQKLFGKFHKEVVDEGNKLKAGDIIIRAGSISNPTFYEISNEIQSYLAQEMQLTVLRKNDAGVNEEVDLVVKPYLNESKTKAVIGFLPELDMASCVVAKSIETAEGYQALNVPRGATITSIDAEPVENFYELIYKINQLKGQRVPLEYYIGDESQAGSFVMDIPAEKESVTVNPILTTAIPFKNIKREYKVSSTLAAAKMSCYMIVDTMSQSYATIKQLFRKDSSVGAKDLTGPVGIAAISYKLVESRDLGFFLYFLGMISCFLAVMNFLPIPIVDGGVFVMLLIEKIKGSPVSEVAQQVLTYIGLALLGTLFIYVTYRDIIRWF